MYDPAFVFRQHFLLTFSSTRFIKCTNIKIDSRHEKQREKRHDAGGEQCIRAKKDLTVIFWKPLWANRCNTKNMCYNVSKGERLVNVFSM